MPESTQQSCIFATYPRSFPTMNIHSRWRNKKPQTLFGLAPDGVYPPWLLRTQSRTLLPYVFTLTIYFHKRTIWRFFSVALSMGLHPPESSPGVYLIWSPDFPHKTFWSFVRLLFIPCTLIVSKTAPII